MLLPAGTVYTVHYKMYTVYYILYTVHCTLYTVTAHVGSMDPADSDVTAHTALPGTLYCTALNMYYCTVLFYTVLYCVMHCTALYYSTALSCSVLPCTVLSTVLY